MSILDAFNQQRKQAEQEARQAQLDEKNRQADALARAIKEAQQEAQHSLDIANVVRYQLFQELNKQQDILATIPTRDMWNQVTQLWRQTPIEDSAVYKKAKLDRFVKQSVRTPPIVVSYPIISALLPESTYSSSKKTQVQLPYADLITGSNWLQFFQKNFPNTNWQANPDMHRNQYGQWMPKDPASFSHSFVTGVYQACSFGETGVVYHRYSDNSGGLEKTTYGINRFIGIACTGPQADLSLWIGVDDQNYQPKPHRLVGVNASKAHTVLGQNLHTIKPKTVMPLSGMDQSQIATQIATILFGQNELTMFERVEEWENNTDWG